MKTNKNIVVRNGELFWVNITGEGKESLNGDGFKYQASIRLHEKTAKPYIQQIKTFFEENKPSKDFKVYTLGYKEVWVDEQGEYVKTESTDVQFFAY